MDVFLICSILLFGILILIQFFTSYSSIKLQNKTSSKILDFIYTKKTHQFLIFGALLSIIVTMLGAYFPPFISLTGLFLSIIFLFALTRKQIALFNPFRLLEEYKNGALRSIADNDEPTLCEWIESIDEAAEKGLYQSSLSLVSAAIDHELEIGKSFLSNSNMLDLQKIGYVLFFIFERLNSLFEKALSKNFDFLCVKINTTFGKLALHSLSTHPHFAALAISFAGNLAKKRLGRDTLQLGLKPG